MIRSALLQLGKSSIVYGIGGVFQRFIGLLLLPFFTHVLKPEDYGVVALISLVGVAMSGLLTLGTSNSMSLLYYKETVPALRPTIIWSNLALMACNGLFWYGVLWLLAPLLSTLMFQTGDYANLIRLAFMGTILSTITLPWLSYLQMEQRAKLYVILTLGGALLGSALSVWFVLFLRWGVYGMLIAGVAGSAIMFVVVGSVVGSKLPFRVDAKLWPSLVRIGFPSVFGLFAFLLIDYVDRQMIERMVGLPELGVYSLGYSFGMVIMIATNAFAAAWPPFFMSYVNKREEARIVFARVLTYYILGFGGLVVLFFFVARPVVLLLTAPAFHEAWTVVGLVAAAYALKGCYLIILPGIYFAEKLSYQSGIEWIAAILNIGLNLALIPIYGILGAALATFLSYLTLPVLAWFISQRYLKVDYEWLRIASCGAVVIAVSVVIFLVYDLKSINWWQLVGLNAILTLTFLFFLFRFLLNSTERHLLQKNRL